MDTKRIRALLAGATPGHSSAEASGVVGPLLDALDAAQHGLDSIVASGHEAYSVGIARAALTRINKHLAAAGTK